MDEIGSAPYNIGFFNRKGGTTTTTSTIFDDNDTEDAIKHNDDENDTNTSGEIIYVDAYLFARSEQPSSMMNNNYRSRTIPTQQLGWSEMMGMFQVDSIEDMTTLISPPHEARKRAPSHQDTATTIATTSTASNMFEQILTEASSKNEADLWDQQQNERTTVTNKNMNMNMFEQILTDVSYKDEAELWHRIISNFDINNKL